MNKLQEIAIISGKGGVGKTSISACFTSVLKDFVIADCDVDASNLHLLLVPKIIKKQTFISGFEVKINPYKCVKCGLCHKNCGFDAIKKNKDKSFVIDEILCEGCGLCFEICKHNAISKTPATCGEISISKINQGYLVDANLKIGAENSGKLVSEVREVARKIATENGFDTIIIDGPPGIGCPAIASISGIDKALIITEASISGLHDFKRALELTNHFKIKTFVCVNKYDINQEITKQIETIANENKATILDKIPYDDDFRKMQIIGKSILEGNSKTSEIIKNIINQIIRRTK